MTSKICFANYLLLLANVPSLFLPCHSINRPFVAELTLVHETAEEKKKKKSQEYAVAAPRFHFYKAVPLAAYVNIYITFSLAAWWKYEEQMHFRKTSQSFPQDLMGIFC